MSRTSFKRVFLTTAASGALWMGIGAAPANAVPFTPFFGGGGSFFLSDNSAERLINADGSFCNPANPASDCTVDEGDRLVGIASINTIENQTTGAIIGVGLSNPYDELTAVFDTTVFSKTAGGSCGSNFCFEFVPTPGWEPPGAIGATPGAMQAWYVDPANNYSRFGTIASSTASASGGSPYWVFGIDDADDFWWAGTDFDNIATGGSGGAGIEFGNFNLGLSLLDNPSGINIAPQDCLNTFDNAAPTLATVEICGGGGVVGKAPASPWDNWDNVDFTINIAQDIPEPGTLSLFGLGLLGLGALSRRRNRKQAA